MQEPVDWEIRHGRDGDVEEVVDLLRSCLGEGGTPRSADFWQWKHQRNPFGPSAVLVATAGEKVVGVRAFLRWKWHSGEREIAAVRAVDTATHPEWQGRGIFSRLTRQLTAQVAQCEAAFVFNTPNRKSGSGYRKMGWRSVGRLPVSIRALRVPGLPGAADSGRTDAKPTGLTTVSALLERPETQGFLAAVERRRQRDPRLRTRATPAYLRWRYDQAPGVDYQAEWAGTGESSAALVLRTRKRRGLLEAALGEILIAGAAGVDTAAELLRSLRSTSRADYAVAVASPGTDEDAALRRSGFIHLPIAGPRLFVHSLERVAEPPDPLQLASWRMTAGSFELF